MDERPKIKVYGEGSVFVNPTKSIITIGAVTEGKSVADAQAENTKIISNVLKAVSQFSIPNELVKTIDYRIDPVYDYTDGQSTLTGYRITHLLELTVKDLNKLGPIIDSAVASGANSISQMIINSSSLDLVESHKKRLIQVSSNCSTAGKIFFGRDQDQSKCPLKCNK